MMGWVAMETAGMASINAQQGYVQTEYRGLGSVKIKIKQNGICVKVRKLIRKYMCSSKNCGLGRWSWDIARGYVILTVFQEVLCADGGPWLGWGRPTQLEIG